MLGKIKAIISYIGVAFVVFLALMTGIDVLGRYAFNSPVRGGVDLTELLLVVIVTCGIVITTAEDNHISVDSVFDKLPPLGKKILLIFGSVVSVLMFAIFVWQGGIGVMDAIRSATGTLMLEIPVFPFKFILALGFFISLIFSIRQFVRLFFNKKG